VRSLALDLFNISYGTSFMSSAASIFRIGHFGDTNDFTILGALAGTDVASKFPRPSLPRL
jgi:aspartate aminotransferase-like enzyme